MKLFNYYKRAAIYPSLFILFFSMVHAVIANYKTGGFTDTSAIVTSIITSLIYCLLMSVLILTIFLNKFEKFNKNLIWNISSWFLLPSFYLTIIFIHDIDIRIKYEFGFGNDFIFLLIMTIPFVTALCWSFVKYRQSLTVIDID